MAIWIQRTARRLAAFVACTMPAIPASAQSDPYIPWTVEATRSCTLVMDSAADIQQWRLCIEAIGEQHPTEVVLLGCAAVIKWHSQADGKVAGDRLRTCFSAGGSNGVE